MKWGWLNWLGVLVAGFVGAALFTIIARIARDTSLLVNSDVIGAAIGASLTIVGTLAIEANRRSTASRRKMDQLRRAVVALDGVAGMALAAVDMDLPIATRATDTATLLGALGGGREAVLFARERADIDEVRLWMKLETVDRCFARFDEQREQDKAALIHPAITELGWASARDRLSVFSTDLRSRLPELLAMLDGNDRH
jgi:hypothetical protein